MRKYLLDATGKEAGQWTGKLRQAALQAPQDCGCVLETERRFIFCSNGTITPKQVLASLNQADKPKRVLLHNLKRRQRQRTE